MLRRVFVRAPHPVVGTAPARPRRAGGGLIVDYQFLGMVAVVLTLVTRGSVGPVVAVTAFVALAMAAYEAGTRCYRRRHRRPVVPPAAASSSPSDSELSRWMPVIDRVLRSPD